MWKRFLTFNQKLQSIEEMIWVLERTWPDIASPLRLIGFFSFLLLVLRCHSDTINIIETLAPGLGRTFINVLSLEFILWVKSCIYIEIDKMVRF